MEMTDRRIIDEVCCYLTLPKARGRGGVEEKGEQLPTLVFLVKVVLLCVEGLLQEGWQGSEKRRAIERTKGRRANKVTRWERWYRGARGKSV